MPANLPPRSSVHHGIAPLAPLALLAFLPLAPGPAASAVLVVDDDGGPGVAFTSIQAAVDAAVDGDVILVHPGSYAGFVVLGKGLDVIAAGPGVTVTSGGVSLRQVPAGSHAFLRGLAIPGAPEEALSILNCAGDVTVERCDVRGADGIGLWVDPAAHAPGYPGIRVLGSTVALLDCEARGGDGAQYALLESGWGPGGPGLHVASGAAVVHGGTYVGGLGGSVLDDDSAYPGADGGDGIQVSDASVYVSGTGLLGGDGGWGGQDGLFGGGYTCGDGGDGGDGVGQEGIAPVDVTLLDVAVTPGVGGLGDLGYGGCPSGADGVTADVHTGTVASIPEQALRFHVPGPIAESGTLELQLDGPAGAPVVIVASAAPAAAALPVLAGPLLVDPLGAQVIPLGLLSVGPTSTFVPLGADLPAGSALILHTQAVYVSPTSGAIVPGAASAAIVLDSAL